MRTILIAVAIITSTSFAMAAAPDGKKLSEIVAGIEQSADFDYIDEIDWNDRGYYEVEYFLKNGSKVETKIDPKTGEIRR